MKYLPLSFALLLAACVPQHGAQNPHTSAARDLERKTVALVASDEEGTQAYCSGVWVGEDIFVTADHCVADAVVGDPLAYVTREDVSVKDADAVAAIRIGTLEVRDPGHDLALVRVKLPPWHGTAAVSAPIVGEVSQTMGHPKGLWWSYSAGNVASVRVRDFDEYPLMWWVQSTAPISPGNSGGGLFNNDGELIGICHSYIPRNAENVNFYVDSRYVQALLDGLKS